MPTPFANLEDVVNSSVISRLANKTLTIEGEEIDGIFNDRFDEVGFVESSNPTFETLTSNIPDVEQGDGAIDALGKNWDVVGVERDGTGITKLELRVRLYE